MYIMSSGVVYEIEGNLDFFKELKNIKNEDATKSTMTLEIEDSQVNKCLITDEPLRKDHIMLECGHKFNYIPLYKEVVFQKYSSLPKNVSSSIVTTYTKNTTPQQTSPTNSVQSLTTTPTYGAQQSSNIITVMYNSSYNLETTKVEYNEIKCPYCRSITHKILPFYPYPEVSKIKYVNTPPNLSLPSLTCEYSESSKSSKGTSCKLNCTYHEKYDMMLCNRHFSKLESDVKSSQPSRSTRRKLKSTENTDHEENIIISHNNPATSVCSFTLLSGPRKGCLCGKPMWIPKMSDSNVKPDSSTSAFCKAHYYKGIQ